MATPTTTTPTATPVKSIKKKVWLCIVGGILIIIGYLLSHQPSITTEDNKILHIPITTTSWTAVEFGDKKGTWDAPEVDNVVQDKLRYWVVANDYKAKPVVMPQEKLVKLGNDIHTLYFRIIPGQSITSAMVTVRFK
jgi:hypothetical protein